MWRYPCLAFENGDHNSDKGSLMTYLFPFQDSSILNQRKYYVSRQKSSLRRAWLF